MTRSFLVVCTAGMALAIGAWLSIASAQPTPPQISPPTVGTQVAPNDFERLQTEFRELRSELAAQRQAQETIRTLIQTVAGAVTIVGVLALLFQVWVFITDSRARRRNQDESAKQTQKEDMLNRRYVRLLETASSAAEKANAKVAALEEGGIKRAADTLQLINNLLQITERAAAKAAGAQFDFLSRSIESLDEDCQKLIIEAKANDERDIVAKRDYSERVRILTKQIDLLDNQIITYNESAPSSTSRESLDSAQLPTERSSARLALTGPCFFIRGLNNHLDQNFDAAINDWKASLEASGAASIEVDANYWIGYENNTLGNFELATGFIKDAAAVANEQRKAELMRLELETRFFALDRIPVPEAIVTEGDAYYDKLKSHRIPARTLSSFATTMGNITLIHEIRSAIAEGRGFSRLSRSTDWYDRALSHVNRTRWARFGRYQNAILSGQTLDKDDRAGLEDVIGSVNREFQNRVEQRSKVLSRITEYMCILMLGGDEKRQATIGGMIELLTGDVSARTIYSQFRKQNVSKDVFLEEFYFLQRTGDLVATFKRANSAVENTRT